MEKRFYSSGKLLLTGEYVVLDGAKALAMPTKFGQSLIVNSSESSELSWSSYDVNNQCWFSATFILNTFELLKTNNPTIASTLKTILQQAKNLNPSFLTDLKGAQVITKLTFAREWGLGTSSTLINNIAQWAQVDGFTLLNKSFGGSGYDIAAAQTDSPLFYQLIQDKPVIKKVNLQWDFTNDLFFVHLNKKQDSKEGIAQYRNAKVSQKDIEKISDLSKKLLLCYTLQDFENIMKSHEKTISDILQIQTVKERLFPDYSGIIKSLGAWGGDFLLATGGVVNQEYFRKKGYTTIIPFNDMIL